MGRGGVVRAADSVNTRFSNQLAHENNHPLTEFIHFLNDTRPLFFNLHSGTNSAFLNASISSSVIPARLRYSSAPPFSSRIMASVTRIVSGL